MKFSFVIVTDGNCWDKIEKVINSINIEMKKSIFEIIVISDDAIAISNINNLWNFNKCDFCQPKGHITAKKNYGVKVSKYENLVITHDYFSLEPGWYEGYCRFNEENPDWELAINPITCMDGKRYRDWICFFNSKIGRRWAQKEPWQQEPRQYWGSPYLLQYNQPGADFISGGYWVCRRHVMEQEPLNEDLVWGQAEDCEASLRWIPKYKYLLNPYSTTRLLKSKDTIFPEIK